jgi:hypothetical protein
MRVNAPPEDKTVLRNRWERFEAAGARHGLLGMEAISRRQPISYESFNRTESLEPVAACPLD